MAWTDKNRTPIYNETEIDFAALAEPVARILLGEPNRHLSTKSNLRFGNKGSLSLNLETGQWFHFEEGAGGGVLDFISREIGGDRANAMRWLADHGFVDGKAGASIAPRPKAARKPKGQDPQTKAKIALAARQWAEARPIEGTPAELYLRRRGIDRWPASVRWCPAFMAHPNDRHPLPAILFPATDAAGAVVAVQAVRLTPEGRKIATRAKTSLGPVGSGFFRLLGRGPLHICEGPETAFSVWIATGAPVFATLGPIAGARIDAAPVVPAGLVVLCGDAAELGSAAARTLEKATAAALERGLLVRVAVPDGAPGADWNDTLQAAGADHVRAAIASAPIKSPEAWGPASYPAPTGTVFDARRRVSEAFKTWTKNVLAYDPAKSFWGAPVSLLRVTTGIGKSHTARRSVVDLVHQLRAKGDERAVALFVPRHDLGDEYMADLAAIAPNLNVASYRGRGAPDPEAKGEQMCRRADEAAEVQRAGGFVVSTLCKKNGTTCPLWAVCGYQKQKQKTADIWILPHSNLWQPPPKNASGDALINAAAIVIDEDPSMGAIAGFDRLNTGLIYQNFDDAGEPIPPSKEPQTALDRLARAFQSMEGKMIDVAHIKKAGITIQDLNAAIDEAKNTFRKLNVTPTTPPDKFKAEVAKVASVNTTAKKLLRLCSLLMKAMLAGSETVPGCRLKLEQKQGQWVKTVHLRWRKDVDEGWKLPTVIASATAHPEVLREIWPVLSDVIDAEAATPHVSHRQVTDKAFGQSSLIAANNEHGALTYTRNQRRRLLRYIEARHFELGSKRTLVIAQKAVIAALQAMGLPAGVETAHFNGLSGLDCFGDVRLIIQIGRTEPGTGDVERMAEVMGQRPVQKLEGYYQRRTAHLNIRGTGQGPAIVTKGGKGAEEKPGAYYHPDPLAEALRWLVCEAEMLQGTGRGRGVNRTTENPLQIDILCNVPLPIAVDEAGAFEAFEPSARDLMAARGVVVLDTSAKGAWAVVSAILPDVYETPDAARKADERSHGQNLNKIPIRICPRENATARVRLAGGRYAVPVAIRAETEAEARALLERILPGADLVEFVPPPDLPVDVDAIEPVAVPRVGDVFARFAAGSAMKHAAIGDTLAKSGLGDAVAGFAAGPFGHMRVGATLRQAEGRRRVAQS